MARRELVPAAAVEAEWSSVLRTVRAGMLAVPSRLSQRLSPAHDVSEIDREVRAALTKIEIARDIRDEAYAGGKSQRGLWFGINAFAAPPK